jgi:hypothetical protein
VEETKLDQEVRQNQESIDMLARIIIAMYIREYYSDQEEVEYQTQKLFRQDQDDLRLK